MKNIIIQNRFTKYIIFELEASTIKQAVLEAVKRGISLRGAKLCGADLCGASLCGADLRDAYFCGADLLSKRATTHTASSSATS